ncbi:MAG: rod shape-determining protein MreD [Planctomycetota bacterium]|nr:rod shape-determining protein MreD [Planctomycetota bacterium]
MDLSPVLFGTVAVYATLVLQTALAPHIALSGVTPRFVPLLVCLLAARCPPRVTLVLSAACGLGADFLTSGPLGVDTSACLFLAGAVHLLKSRGWLEFPVTNFAWIAFSVALHTAFGIVIRGALDGRGIDDRAIYTFAIASACYTAGFALGGRVLFAGLLATVTRHRSA